MDPMNSSRPAWLAVAVFPLLLAACSSPPTWEKAGATETQLAPALALQRKAQWRLDFVAAENSMGFHAPAETLRILGESIDYARQGITKVALARAKR